MHINASHHGALGIVLVEITVTNNIPKCYSREFSVTNDILKEHYCDTMYVHIGQDVDPDYLSRANVLNKEDGFYMFLGLLVFTDVGIWCYACYDCCMLSYPACILHFDLVSTLFGTSIPTFFNILVKMMMILHLFHWFCCV